MSCTFCEGYWSLELREFDGILSCGLCGAVAGLSHSIRKGRLPRERESELLTLLRSSQQGLLDCRGLVGLPNTLDWGAIPEPARERREVAFKSPKARAPPS